MRVYRFHAYFQGAGLYKGHQILPCFISDMTFTARSLTMMSGRSDRQFHANANR